MEESKDSAQSSEDRTLIGRIQSLIDQRAYVEANDLVDKRLSQSLDTSNPRDAYLVAILAGLLIDIGEEGDIEQAALDGVKLFEAHYQTLSNHVKEVSLQYNMGNGKSSLFKIRRKNPGFQFRPNTITLLTEAKNHYWKAFKLLQPEDEDLRPQLLVNLANTLSTSCRVVEALQYFDLTLQQFPEFPQANANRSEALLWLNHLSDTYSVTMLQQMKTGFEKAAMSDEVPSWLQQRWRSQYDAIAARLAELGHSDTTIEHDLNVTLTEFEALSAYRKYCLLNHLTLSEHSLYCKCNGARRDDLTIPLTTARIGGTFVPRMEHVLNRLKAEFGLARLLYYRALEEADPNSFGEEVTFTELYEGEVIGLQSEMLRASFRLCFGILDKIAHAVCELYKLARPEESIYFESFWRQNEERWEKINLIESYPLMGLYSQATDLNAKNGEWGIYKMWRNGLEHEMFIIGDLSTIAVDPYSVFDGEFPIQRVSYGDFQTKTLHILQLVRSAIFNFVFCVRQEGSKNLGERGVILTLAPKE